MGMESPRRKRLEMEMLREETEETKRGKARNEEAMKDRGGDRRG